MRKNISEEEINRADVKSILKTAADSRNKPSGLGKYIKSLRKKTIDVADLQKAWADAQFPDDTRDIESLLLAHGFSKSEIKKVFVQVFGEDPDDEEGYGEPPEKSDTILKLAEYAKKNGLDKDLLAFLQQEYGFNESSVFAGKMVVEQIRDVFAAIVKEERSGRAELVKQHEQTQLGRSKK